MKLGTLCIAMFLGCAIGASGCSRRAIEAVNIANEADQQKKVDVDGAITKYEQAVQLDPTNHRIIYKLAMAYKKKEAWEKVASTLARATQVAPKFANYWYERGFALVQVADKNPKSRGAWEEAKEPLNKCVENDPNFANCYHELGTVSLYLDDEQSALDNYTKAILHKPSEGMFYVVLSDLYLRLGYIDQAEGVLKEGIENTKEFDRALTEIDKSKEGGDKLKAQNSARFNIYQLLSVVCQTKGDQSGMVSALEQANRIGGADHPEILFNLGSTYAVLKDQNKKKQAIEMLKQFFARGCKGGKSDKYKEQCEQTNALLAKLETAI